MTDQSSLARLVRDPSTGEMVWLEPSTDSLDLSTLPERLDDEMLERVTDIARRPLPALSPCDRQRLVQALRMMLAVLPRRQADDVSGELFVAAYERQLGHYCNEAIEHLCDEAMRTCKWFPTIAECLEILSGWRRTDEAVRRKSEAERIASRERRERSWEKIRARQEEPTPPITQEAVDAMDDTMRRLGVTCGAIIQDDDGNYRPAA